MNTSFQTTSEQSLGRFGNAQRLLGHLDANVISNLITTTSDVVLVMDENGFIEDAAFANPMRSTNGEQFLVGKCGVFNETILVHHEHHVRGGGD